MKARTGDRVEYLELLIDLVPSSIKSVITRSHIVSVPSHLHLQSSLKHGLINNQTYQLYNLVQTSQSLLMS